MLDWDRDRVAQPARGVRDGAAGRSRSQQAAAVRAAVLSALAEPAGAAVGLAAVGIAPALNPCFVAFAAGAMLFVSVHELLPMVRRHRHGGSFAAGAALGALVFALLGCITAAAFTPGTP
jgi:zinc transporter ZupT